MTMFNESLFYKTLQDFFINNNKETFLQLLAEFYNRTEDVMTEQNNQSELIKELRELYEKLNENGIDNNVVIEKVNYFLENNLKIKDITSQINNVAHDKDYSNNSVLPIYDEPIITFVIDDGSTAYIDMFQNVFETNDIKPTLAIISDWVGRDGYLTLSQLKDYKKKGYEIVGHSATHNATIYKNNGSDVSVSADLKKCHQFLKQNDFNSDVIVYPWGNFTSPNFYKNIARKYFNIGINAVAPNIINNKIPDTMYLERLFIQKNVSNLEKIKEKIDYAKNNNGWLIFGLHTNEDECDTQLLSDIIQYIKSNNIKVRNISDAFKIKGNKLSIGEYDDIRSLYINTKGEIKNGFNIERWNESKKYSVDRSPAEYENGLTLLNIHPDNNGGTACTLLNFKGDNPDFYFQIKREHNTNQLYIRQWNNTTSTWGNFNKNGSQDVVETFNISSLTGYTKETRTVIKKINNVLHCNISLVNSLKTGEFKQGTVLCKIDKKVDTTFKEKIVPCIITTGDGKVLNSALIIKRDVSDGKICVTCYVSLANTNIRWIDTEFTIIE